MDLLALADFTLVARHGGFGRAARAAERPKATLSRRVADLEASLGVRLFERGSHTLKLTQEGRALFERTETLLTEIGEAATSIASGGEVPRGRLRISAPLLFSQMTLGTLSARFALRYPEVRLEITTEDRAVDMVEEGYDLVIRVNPDPDERLIGRVLLRDRLVAVASPALEKPEPEGAVRAVVRASGSPAAWALTTVEGDMRMPIEPVLRLASLIMIRDAVRTGIGAAVLPLSLVAGDLRSGALVQWGDVKGKPIEIWALYPSRRLLSARVSAFLALLKEAFPLGQPEELTAYLTGESATA
ncbi:DNA-binding transcriptional LysR family regulator [Pseudoxanthomonas japonensis]|uniref:LysR family transcriptional regulator n=1 Tax=Pseudoxanthomonas japonensis TaxID=69284 RepID=UPI0028592955|nr:LysR substrate-binding domain-containing protein [Pseudoxanthomonas japonensis]MDR7069799.1 DNA-binding transcriptional LysR family regulator [Pseudoxanthomonas japonensis]